ncbi:MAG: bifunctional proline dehydrogenase/L-glutamate gamma-semialdehyde dehydrogenase PutA [Maricaulis sp.]|uniref:bifunctional proline dehydrogenase/L-glutamate gamma-semialdehyde dehydrogenase PutA n=1 Tax=Maricaulis sp. TaxID=1486257 RepID=UPI00260F9674|nr:bifunctional proline dehydrogenase/L-glutamate gamma-semialdehyde dehydrogenase PutA [Maricaulis sp.]MDM7984382.1 bifunctional proline dehydrogenase/L-glutamate gamma-semialdehyde dehydrogenase PutA [Maricaulis sp.]
MNVQARNSIEWDEIDHLKFANESELVQSLVEQIGFSDQTRDKVRDDAIDLVKRARASTRVRGLMESFLQEFGLSNKEGLALMCLAEALLRVPDGATADKLIAEKISTGEWGEHAGKSENWLVNASTLGLMLTGKIIDVEPEARKNPGAYLKQLTARAGEPVIRAATMQAMRIMGEQFVLGRTISAALKRAGKYKDIGSFDMLGEGARTAADAKRYHQRYLDAIEAVGAARGDGPIEKVHGVSVKLSALNASYLAIKEERVMNELYPMVLEQARAAKAHDIGFCIDAEESDRLIISLKILDRLARDPSLRGWNGLGLAVQAYQKRAGAVIDGLVELAKQSGRRFLVRLVKGAYWDTEIKFGHQMGWPDFPVWTTKTATDLHYLVCAKRMLAAPREIYAQFATHNAHTLASVRELAHQAGVDEYEFQRLHGMGEPLYAASQEAHGERTARVYAPVGSHEDLLPYLVRRLLENGANTSFVHSFLDDAVPVEDVARGPFEKAEGLDRHPQIPMPDDLYGDERPNSVGVDISQRAVQERLARAMAELDAQLPLSAGPLIDGRLVTGEPEALMSPVDRSQHVGNVVQASEADVDTAFRSAVAAFPVWNAAGGEKRGAILRAMADIMEQNMDRLIALMSREAGKNIPDGIAEVREAIDFCRYYGAQAEREFAGADRLLGPAGETNHLGLQGRGVFVCISPWNFPLAIFAGQVAAALAAGNVVLAKPAEQTPVIACEAVKLFQEAGLPAGVLQLLPGTGETVGAALTRDNRTAGVAFTGSTEVARLINRSLAARDTAIAPLIAETGGLNGMFVDTTALKEQVVDDAIMSAFGSAGQRCSALRIIFLPDDTADEFVEALCGAMDELGIGDPSDITTDVGPVIDAEALGILESHMERMTREATVIKQLETGLAGEHGSFFGPALVELPSLDLLEREVFGPVLHVYRYKRKDLPAIAAELAAKGYGLTLGIHSRLESFHRQIQSIVPAGNVYVNRNMIGAVVGVQPFGGEGLSGTGPKAGGPHYLHRFAGEKTVTINISAQGGDPELLNLS